MCTDRHKFSYQLMININRSDVWFQLPPEELSQIPVQLQVFNLSFLQVTAKHPDVES